MAGIALGRTNQFPKIPTTYVKKGTEKRGKDSKKGREKPTPGEGELERRRKGGRRMATGVAQKGVLEKGLRVD